MPIIENAATVIIIRIPAKIAWPYSPRAIDPVDPTRFHKRAKLLGYGFEEAAGNLVCSASCV